MSDLKLGCLVGPEQQRDAVHVAVAPVTASEELKPGQHIGLADPKNTELASSTAAMLIGIVDPYLKANVLEGERFLMWLYPNSVTGMRHEWQHPAFFIADVIKNQDTEYNKNQKQKVKSVKFIEEFAEEIGQSYDGLLEDAENYAKRGITATDNSQDYENMSHDDWTEFWEHFSNVTGIEVDDDTSGAPYHCSC